MDISNNSIPTNTGEYVVFCNQMKQQYLEMENHYKAEIGILTIMVARLRSDLRFNRSNEILENERKKNVRALLDIIKFIVK